MDVTNLICAVTFGTYHRKRLCRSLVGEKAGSCMELKIDTGEALVLSRVLRNLLPHLEQEAYAEQEAHNIDEDAKDSESLEDEVVVRDVLERIESNFFGFSGK